MRTSYEVAVIGAGPAGSMAAKYASKYGAKTLLIEEHGQIGKPTHCTGLLSKAVLKECEIEEGEFIFNRVRGAYVYAPDGKSVVIDGRETKAYVVDREAFDRELADRAMKSGAEVLMNTRALKFSRGKIETISNGKKVEIKCKVAISADGLKSKIARAAGLGRVKKVLGGAQIEAGYRAEDERFVEIFLGGEYAPGFFSWAVPLDKSRARIGVATGKGAGDCLKYLLSRHPVVSRKYSGEKTDLTRGGIPIGTLKKTVSSGLLVAGDAAGQVKPTSGGGVYMGAICAKIAGEVAAKAALEGDNSEKRLGEYEKRWRGRVGKELAIGMKLHESFAKLSDKEINEVIEVLGDRRIQEIITKYGDIDHPSIVFKKLLLSNKLPQLWKLFAIAARAVII